MAKEEERLYGVYGFRVGEAHYIPHNSIFKDKVEVITDGYGVITGVTNRDKLIRLSLPVDIDGISIDEIGQSAFAECKNLEMAVLPKSIERIADSAFRNCTKLRAVVLSDKIYHIGESAFEGCKEIESLNLPNCLESIGARAFYGCSDLKSISIDSDVNLGTMCFASCDNLAAVSMENVKELPDGIFISSGLRKIRLSSTLERIGISAFSRCKKLEEIFFDGSIDEFRRISFGINWNKEISPSCALFVRDRYGKYYNAFEKKMYDKTVEDLPNNSDLALLGIDSKKPTVSEINKAYRDKARRFHPDILSGLNLDSAYTEFASKQFRLYTEAYERLIKLYKK